MEPLLKGYGVGESNRPIRTEIDSAFSRLYEFESPAMMEAFRGDPEWFEQWRKLGLIRGAFSPYETPAGPGKDVGAGEGQPVLAGRGRERLRLRRLVLPRLLPLREHRGVESALVDDAVGRRLPPPSAAAGENSNKRTSK